jgi:hypothetical protein
MDFIEQWFGVSPDNGNGSLEFLYIVAVAAVGALIWRWWSARKAARKSGVSRDDRA